LTQTGSDERHLSFALRGTLGKAGQDHQVFQSQAAVVLESDRDDANSQDIGKRQPTMLSTVSPLSADERTGSSSRNDRDEKRRPGPEEYVLSAKDFSQSERSGGEQKKVLEYQSALSASALDKFERMAEQMVGKSRNHGLTVKLDVGNEESVTVGLKDLGQTVAVEVKASNQGLINLLQSQKDVILKHLEGRDVRANIFIDPNGSGNPERRERRETEQRPPFPSFRKREDGFGRLLEIMA